MPLIQILLAILVAIFFSEDSQAQVLKAKSDITIQILPKEEAAEIFNLDHDELIVPSLKPPKVKGSAGYFAIDAVQMNQKPLVLWLKKDPTLYSNLKPVSLELEVQPKFRVDEATIFKTVGKSLLDCDKPDKPCVATPSKGTVLTFVTAKLVESVDPADQVVKWRLFYEVNYKFNDRVGNLLQGKGWISSEDVLVREKPAQVTTVPPPKPVVPKPTMVPMPAEFETVLSQISSSMGECVVPNNKKVGLTSLVTTANPAFNQTLLPYWKKKLVEPPSYTYKGQTLTKAQVLAIDTMARTIYGEMATCNFSAGPGYLMAVAKVILNRVSEGQLTEGKRSQFMCNPNSKEQSGACTKMLADPEWIGETTQVIVKPFQFSTWNNDRTGDLRRVLCPSGRTREDLSKTKEISAFERTDVENWQDSLRVAAEAILEPEIFKLNTSEVRANFYVSGAAGIAGHTRMSGIPKINGQPLDKGRCIKFLRPMTKAEIIAANKAAEARAAAKKAEAEKKAAAGGAQK